MFFNIIRHEMQRAGEERPGLLDLKGQADDIQRLRLRLLADIRHYRCMRLRYERDCRAYLARLDGKRRPANQNGAWKRICGGVSC